VTLAEWSELARGVYGVALGVFLPASLLLVRWLAPRVGAGVKRVSAMGSELAAALREHSAALRGSTVAPERLEHLERLVGEIHAATVRR
jgi:uncharacterized protein (DUF2236 family)